MTGNFFTGPRGHTRITYHLRMIDIFFSCALFRMCPRPSINIHSIDSFLKIEPNSHQFCVFDSKIQNWKKLKIVWKKAEREFQWWMNGWWRDQREHRNVTDASTSVDHHEPCHFDNTRKREIEEICHRVFTKPKKKQWQKRAGARIRAPNGPIQLNMIILWRFFFLSSFFSLRTIANIHSCDFIILIYWWSKCRNPSCIESDWSEKDREHRQRFFFFSRIRIVNLYETRWHMCGVR